jgi:cathepsin L
VVFALLLVACLLLATEARRPRWHELDGYGFAQYEKDFGKRYASPAEREHRRTLFERRLQQVKAWNSRPNVSYKKGVNAFSDKTDEEIRVRGVIKPLLHEQVRSRPTSRIAKLDLSMANASSVDWRDSGIISAVKDQGQCGSCWTFGTAETVESYNALMTGQLPVLSEQQILDCTPNPMTCGGVGGCGGGTPELAYGMIYELGGLASEWTYPYLSYWGGNSSGICYFNSTGATPPGASIQGFQSLPSNQYAPVIAQLQKGPLAVNVDASAWGEYESGVFTGCNNSAPDIDHVVQLVGYGTDAKHGDYWLVRNSWSPAWGEDGYIRIARNSQTPPCGVDPSPMDGTGCKGGPSTVKVCGECGMLYDTSFPLMSA